MPNERLEATVRGRVQGVGFRMFAAREAADLGVTGWVANTASGEVRCVAEGPREALEQLARALREGPPGARVDDMAAGYGTATDDFTRFEIRSGWHGGD